MHADPNPIGLIRENIDIVIATADRAQLCRRALLQVSQRSQIPR